LITLTGENTMANYSIKNLLSITECDDVTIALNVINAVSKMAMTEIAEKSSNDKHLQMAKINRNFDLKNEKLEIEIAELKAPKAPKEEKSPKAPKAPKAPKN